MGARALFCTLAVLFAGCTPAPTPLSPTEVQDFVRQYVAANKAADATKMMGLISRDAGVSSVGLGKIYRGWEAIRTATDESIASTSRLNITIGTIDVTPIGPDAAVAVASMTIGPVFVGRNTLQEAPGAMTIIVKRTPEGLRLIHEHYSLRPV